MDNDDALVGRVLKRREIFALFGAAGVTAVLAACSSNDSGSARPSPAPAGDSPSPSSSNSPSPATQATSAAATATTIPGCVVSPELTEGPYFVDEKLNRSDIRLDPGTGAVKQGVPLALAFNVLSAGASGCAPVAGAMVDVWHCDALGVYSDVQDPGGSTKGQKFLRGYQMTDGAGKAQFLTIFPGWYQGRTVHIHFKVRGTRPDGKNYEFTSQLFFDDAIAAEIFKQPPYSAKGASTTKNNADGIYRQGGSTLLLPIQKSGSGYAGTFDIGIKLT